MKRLIAVLIALLLMPSVTLAAKPVKVDLKAMIEQETTDREEAVAALQSQIDTLQSLIHDINNSNKFGNILVYDANDQFLGILLSAFPGYSPNNSYSVAEILIPSLGLATIILETGAPTGPVIGDIIETTTYFPDIDCSGDPYLTAINPDILYRSGSRYFYAPGPMLAGNVLYSSYGYGTATPAPCTNWSATNQYAYDAIEVLEADIPFTLPIALPLRYEY